MEVVSRPRQGVTETIAVVIVGAATLPAMSPVCPTGQGRKGQVRSSPIVCRGPLPMTSSFTSPSPAGP